MRFRQATACRHALPRGRPPAVSGIAAGRQASRRLANFWIIEGVATYFETLREHDDPTRVSTITVGESTPAGCRRPASGC